MNPKRPTIEKFGPNPWPLPWVRSGIRSPIRAAATIAFCLALVAAPVFAAEESVGSTLAHDARAILAAKCYQCHGPDAAKREADLRLDLEESAKATHDSKAAIVPLKPDESEVVRRVTSDDADERMPPANAGASLSADEIKTLRDWIAAGASFERHWSFAPIARPPLPSVKNESWQARDWDRFILARLEAAGLRPAGDADRRELLRRVYFDLIGLPPTPEQVAAFMGDSSEGAYENVVNSLLASPQFGERWARHWLDLVRYAETFGYEHDWPIPLAWRYRDYVIRMWNADVPYDQIVREHVCGDLLAQPRRNPDEGFNESIIGTGFWYLHGQMSQPVDVRQHQADRFDNQIDVYSRAFLGLTMACARCHDHKFDPLSTEDYYSLVGYLRSSRRQEAYLDPGDRIAKFVAELDAVRREANAALAALPERVDEAVKDDGPADSELFEDFRGENYAGWNFFGQAFGDGPTGGRVWDRVAGGATPLRSGLAHSGLLSGKLRGTLQSREFTLGQPQIWLKVSGKGTARIVIDGYMLQRYKDQLFVGTEVKFDVPTTEFRWVALDRDVRLYEGHAAYLEIEDDSDGIVIVDEIRFAPGAPPAGSVGNVSLGGDPAHDGQFAPLAARMAEIEGSLPPPLQVLAMCDGTPTDAKIQVRGNVRVEGPVAPRRMPLAIYGNMAAPASGGGSGRLAWAERVLERSDPLLARVRVNWVWHHLMGRGIVPSLDNFGAVGEPPTHRELLDYLSDRFRSPEGESEGWGWSLKRLIREIVLSRTYRMSSRPADAEAERVDPENGLWHRARVRRIEGEAIRDALLAVSGRLDPRMAGASIPVHLTPFMQGLGRPEKSGPLDGDGRRSIYLEVRRNFLAPMFSAFDAPVPATCVARRSVSNVPAQALILMNDPLVAEQARLWAERVLREGANADWATRIERMYVAALARPATPEELTRAKTFFDEQAAAYGVAPEQAAEEKRIWADFAHSLFSVKEFFFIR